MMIYLDNCSSTKIDIENLNEYTQLLTSDYINPSSTNKLALQINSRMEKARQTIVSSLNLEIEKYHFIATASASEANNMVLKTLISNNPAKLKTIITTKMEHSSVANTLNKLKAEKKLEIVYVKFNKQTKQLDYEHLAKITKEHQPDLVSIIEVNNETGFIVDVQKVSEIVKANSQALIHIDGVQAFTKITQNYNSVDYYVVSGHKINSIKGIAGVIKKNNAPLYKLIDGGAQEFNLRAGTENAPALIAFASQVERLTKNKTLNYQKVLKLKEIIFEKLSKNDQINLNNQLENSSPYIVNLSLPGYPSEVIVNFLEINNIIVSALSSCSQKSKSPNVLEKLGYDLTIAKSAIRICLSKATTIEEIEYLIEIIEKIPKELIRME